MEMIFMKVKKDTDLLNYRLVCRKWHSVVSSVCRRRGLYPILKKSNPIEIFRDLEHLPWSSCSLADLSTLTVEELRNFLKVFGSRIWKLHINRNDFYLLTFTLAGITKMREIEWSDWHSGSADIGNKRTGLGLSLFSSLSPSLTLRHQMTQVTRLKFNLRQVSALHIANLILSNAGVSLRHVELSIGLCFWEESNDNTREDFISGVRVLIATLLTLNVPSVSLLLEKSCINPTELFKNFERQDKRLSVSELSMQNGSGDEEEGFKLVEMLVPPGSQSLKILKLCTSDSPRALPRTFAFPIPLPSLTTLKFTTTLGRHVNPALYEPGFISSSRFPKLRLLFGFLCHNAAPYLDTSAPFPNVDEVVMEECRICYYNNSCNPITPSWADIFPKLRSLELPIKGEGDLLYVLKHLNQLESLTLCIRVMDTKMDFDINSVLSGVPDAKAVSGMSISKIRNLRAKHKLPSLLDFRSNSTLRIFVLINLTSYVSPSLNLGLTRFALDAYTRHSMQDSGVILCLLAMQPLHLNLRGQSQTRECVHPQPIITYKRIRLS